MSWSKLFKKSGLNWFFRDVFYRLHSKDVNPYSVKTFLKNQVNLWYPDEPRFNEFKGDNDSKMLAVQKWVRDNIKYTGDSLKHGQIEYWQEAEMTLNFKTGDCIAEYEEIITKEGIKKAKDVKVGDLVLSYDLKEREFIYKPIVKKWDKGKLPIKRVHFRNGQHIDVTENHHMAVRDNQKKSNYVKQDLKDIDLSRWWKRKVPIAKKIPYNKSKPVWKKELYKVIGHYVAEGWCEKSGKVQSSGYELIEEIIPLLEKNNIPFSEYLNNSGVPCINFLKSEFKEYLKGLKKNSSDINLYEELIYLPEEYLEELLFGMWLGDGTKKQYPDKRGHSNNKVWTYSTSSEQLARDIQSIGLHLGRTFHIWKQEKHQGKGNKPIWRINYNSNSVFMRDFGYENLSEVSISFVEDLKKVQCYDWEVKDTHTFFFRNGIMTFQCEDGAILMYVLARHNLISPAQLRLCAGWVKSSKGKTGHCWLEYKSDCRNEWHICDWCFNVDTRPFKNRMLYFENDNYLEKWWEVNDITWK